MVDLIERVLALVAGVASNLVEILPVGYAFGSGMLATVNPCGFALLPAYLSLYLGDASGMAQARPLRGRLLKAIMVSVAVTAGFVLLFGAVGAGISAGGRFLVTAMPWAGLLVGLALIGLGTLLLFNRGKVYLGVTTRLAAKIHPGQGNNAASYFLFGIAYGVASLSCTLPVFLIVVGSALTADNFGDSLLQFFSYALGMGATLTALTLGLAVFKEAAGRYLRRALPYVERASAVLITLAGVFIVYYWLTIGGLGEQFLE